ncbi:MAG: hypothetical protein AB1515_02335 [Nitrospirota bacterium]
MAKPESFFELKPESNKRKAQQTRIFDISDEKALLSASAAVLQDLGFQVEESSVGLGVLRAAKERSARQVGQEILQGFVFVLGLFGQKAIILPVDLHQRIGAVLVTRQAENDASRFIVRILFYRTVWKGDGNTGDQYITPGEQRMEVIYDERIYQQFFAKLSKGLFLEAHQI